VPFAEGPDALVEARGVVRPKVGVGRRLRREQVPETAPSARSRLHSFCFLFSLLFPFELPFPLQIKRLKSIDFKSENG
jgi:hypothetical protein